MFVLERQLLLLIICCVRSLSWDALLPSKSTSGPTPGGLPATPAPCASSFELHGPHSSCQPCLTIDTNNPRNFLSSCPDSTTTSHVTWLSSSTTLCYAHQALNKLLEQPLAPSEHDVSAVS